MGSTELRCESQTEHPPELARIALLITGRNCENGVRTEALGEGKGVCEGVRAGEFLEKEVGFLVEFFLALTRNFPPSLAMAAHTSSPGSGVLSR